ncbi:MAG: hypothetical protein C6W56_05020 [Caldibacillus debilis]|nr:MAG: hypothetical protein C6W56_05020 [Caldibacillus debilis]
MFEWSVLYTGAGKQGLRIGYLCKRRRYERTFFTKSCAWEDIEFYKNIGLDETRRVLQRFSLSTLLFLYGKSNIFRQFIRGKTAWKNLKQDKKLMGKQS